MDHDLTPGRLKDESWEAYKVRRKLADQAVKKYCRGVLFWPSEIGTYNKRKVEEAIKHNSKL